MWTPCVWLNLPDMSCRPSGESNHIWSVTSPSSWCHSGRGLLFSNWKTIMLQLVNSCPVPPQAGLSDCAALSMGSTGVECHMCWPLSGVIAGAQPSQGMAGRQLSPGVREGDSWVKASGQYACQGTASSRRPGTTHPFPCRAKQGSCGRPEHLTFAQANKGSFKESGLCIIQRAKCQLHPVRCALCLHQRWQ